jgi:PAS domain S-box-containing protein
MRGLIKDGGATETTASERVRHHQAERLNLALRTASDGLWDWDLENDVVYYSPRWKEILGYSEGELENHIDTWKLLVDPADRERVLRLVDDVVAGRAPKLEAEFRMRHKDGRWLDILSRATLLRDKNGHPTALVGLHLDITALRQAEVQIRQLNESLEQRVRERTAELAASEARLALLIETVPAGIVIHGPDGRILQSNPAAQRLLGLSADEARDKPLSDSAWHFVRADGTPMTTESFPVTQVLKHRAPFWNQVVGIIRSPGSPPLWSLVNALPQLTPDGRILAVIVGFMDITALMAAEAALRQANETLEQRVALRTAALHESENRFRTLAKASFEGVMLSRQGRIEDCNDQLAAILGHSRSEILGRNAFEFIPPE